MPTIIRDRSAVRGAQIEDLNHTYGQLSNDAGFKGFKSRAAAEVQVEMLLSKINPFQEGTMSHKLHEEISDQKPIEPRSESSEARKRVVVQRVMATFTGESKPQTGSLRNQILLFIQQCENHTCTAKELQEQFKQPIRGHLQKLIEKHHLVTIEEA